MSASFSPTSAEISVVSQIFAKSDPQKLGVLTGDVAVRVFGGAKLPPTVLGEIWNLADDDNKGWLSRKEVAIAVRLIGYAQKGDKLAPSLLSKPGPLAIIEGVNVVSQQNTGLSLPKSPPPGFPPLTPQDRTKFHNMFVRSGPSNGLINGEMARDIFVKSKLSNEKLLQIWNLADTKDRGALDSTDFAIGMYFIQGVMSGQITYIPSSLPPGLYQQAGGVASGQGSVRSHTTGNSGSFSPVGSTFNANRAPIQQQHTGQMQTLQSDMTGLSSQPRGFSARPNAGLNLGSNAFHLQSNGNATQWDVTPAEQANSDRFFDTLDTQKRGYVEGDVAVPFMLESKLPGEDLAQIWDLADIRNDGHLTRDEFAVAVHLIQKKLAGVELPAVLPQALVPPSMRDAGSLLPTSTPSQPQPEPDRDLFSFDDTPPMSATFPQPTSSLPQTQSLNSASAAHSSIKTSSGDPFTVHNSTSFHHDLFGDDDGTEASSAPLHDRSAEIGNVKNQLSSTNRSVDTTKAENANLQETLADQASQLSALQTQLSSARATYETETKLLATLKDRHLEQTSDIQKTREELIRAESDLSAVRVEKSEVEGSFLRDKEDARELHRRVLEITREVETLKNEIEKIKKEAKQQKGLLAIARKQLSTKEGDKTKVEKELEDANAELSSIVKEKDQVETELVHASTPPIPAELPHIVEKAQSMDSLEFAARQPLPVSPEPASPAGSQRNNPFDRLLSPGTSTPRPKSAFLPFSSALEAASPVRVSSPSAKVSDDLVDNFFGEAISANIAIQHSPKVDASLLEETIHDSSAPIASSTWTTDGSEYFATPQVTSLSGSHEASPTPLKMAEAIAIDSTAQFPPAEDVASASSSDPVERHEDSTTFITTTNLGDRLQEIVQDSESDTDSDDEVPLAELSLASKEDKLSKSAPANDVSGVLTSTEPQEKSQVSFDDVFGDRPETVAKHGNHEPPLIAPTQSTISFPPPPIPLPSRSEPADVSAFDETLSKIPSSSPPETTQFSFNTFDSAFEDNFDFATATAKSSGIPPSELPQSKEENGPISFDDIFTKSATSNTIPPSVEPSVNVGTETIGQTNKPGLSFDEAFSGFDAGPSLNLDNSFTSTTSPRTIPASPTQISPKPTSSPRTANSPSFSLPQRETSPSPRVSSPKPRPSTSSSKEAHEKIKEPPPRHSKLSIRLPFGRKKKQEAPPPPPPTHLQPTREEARTVSPAVDDDVEPVKQLTAMGFSRSQAVVALEKYGYDVQRALNSLLNTQ